ncbi:MAG: alpha/beta hydrolase-fold protein [Myxococcales bacterium]|nr:alpha/beta hydrolase-fold protein [Myxococcales bacterium]
MARVFVGALVLALAACGAVGGSDAGVDAGAVPLGGGFAASGGSAGGGSAGGASAGGSVAGGMAAGGSAVDAGVVTTIRVHYPTGARRMFLRGALLPLLWTAGVAMQQVDAETWEYSMPAQAQDLEFKPRLDEQEWSKGPNFVVKPGQTLDVYPRFFTDSGQVSRRWPAFRSTVLNNSRGVLVYLPPTYLENTTFRAPVVYMHDGQNLFDPATAFGGNEWQVDETMNRTANDGFIAEAIVIAPENGGAARIDEYTPTNTTQYGGGKGGDYLRFLVEELKPAVDREYRTLPARERTVVIGSSLGGLISVYAGVQKPDVFGNIGAMSPSTWWDNRWILGSVAGLRASPLRPLKVYVDSGNAGTSMDDVTNTAALAQAWRDRGYADDATLMYVVQNGGTHSETFWAQRLPVALRFLLGPGR